MQLGMNLIPKRYQKFTLVNTHFLQSDFLEKHHVHDCVNIQKHKSIYLHCSCYLLWLKSVLVNRDQWTDACCNCLLWKVVLVPDGAGEEGSLLVVVAALWLAELALMTSALSGGGRLYLALVEDDLAMEDLVHYSQSAGAVRWCREGHWSWSIMAVTSFPTDCNIASTFQFTWRG